MFGFMSIWYMVGVCVCLLMTFYSKEILVMCFVHILKTSPLMNERLRYVKNRKIGTVEIISSIILSFIPYVNIALVLFTVILYSVLFVVFTLAVKKQSIWFTK